MMDTGSVAEKDKRPPLWIHPLASRKLNPEESDSKTDGSYRVIQQLVSPSPNPHCPEAEIETVLEAYVSPKGGCLWRRVAVWSGLTSQRVLHASFTLPNQQNEGEDFNLNQPLSNVPIHEQPSLLCWAAFPERHNHKLLCVLVSPSILTIWDVYPAAEDADSDRVYISAEGHSVSLPFQCNGIYPLGESHGILLERKQDQEDFEARKASEAFPSIDIPNPELEDEFFLKAPPRNTRISGIPLEHNNLFSQQPHGGAPLSTPRTAYTAASVEVSSLFSLKHPLEDVLPVSLWSPDNNGEGTLVTDVFEKILYSSTLRWADHQDHYSGKRENQHPICVTYNTMLMRHAIWAIKGAPAPAAVPPLWQRSRKLRCAKDFDAHIGMIDQDFEDMELLGIVDPALHDGPTRDEALADALGVRKTPRKSSIEPRPRNNRADTTAAASANRSGFLNPSRSMRDGSVLETEISQVDMNPHQLLNMRPLANLRPNVAIECLFEEDEEGAAATNVFLTSNLEGSGLLVVGLVCPSTGEQSQNNNPNTLRLLALEPFLTDATATHEQEGTQGTLSETRRHYFSVNLVAAIPCMAAEPIRSTPVPLCLRPSSNRRTSRCGGDQATDILVLKGRDNSQSYMCLYRSLCDLTTCALMEGDDKHNWQTSHIRAMKNPVRGMVDIVTDKIQIRTKISLALSDETAEKVLAAIESAMFATGDMNVGRNQMEFALKLRADCRRCEQALQQDNTSCDPCSDAGWFAVASVLDAIVHIECFVAPESSKLTKGASSMVEEETSPWALLLGSSFHANFNSDEEDTLFLGNQDSQSTDSSTRKVGSADLDLRERLLTSTRPSVLDRPQPGTSVVATLFDSLHLMYEDCKLSSDSNRVDQLRKLGSFLVRTCCKCLRVAESPLLVQFLEHYKVDLGASWVKEIDNQISTLRLLRASTGSCPLPLRPTTFDSPPNILEWVDNLVKHKPRTSVFDTGNFSAINAVCGRTQSLLRIFKALFENGPTSIERDFKVVSVLSEEGFQTANQVRDGLPPGLALPLLEALKRCSESPHWEHLSTWTRSEFHLVERLDLGCNSGRMSLDLSTKHRAKSSSLRLPRSNAENPSFADKDNDGLVPLQASSAMLFPTDNRIKEVGRLLRSSTPSFLFVERAIEVSDHEYERMKQNRLLLLCRRALALPVGRGMLTFGSFQQPVAAEPLPIPDLCMVGRVPPTNANLALDMSECQSGFKIWPIFHNGVAAGLRLPLAGESESISKITRTWIVYNRPSRLSDAQPNGQPPALQSQSHAHGGLLLALGLRGHLSALEMTDIYDYLIQGQVTLTCGVLLGMAASKRGTCDISVSKMLCLHLPSLIPQHFSAIDVASPAQTAAVTGAGLLFQGSSHRMMTEFLLNEIGRRPESDVTLDREAYTLSCGIALGMVNICKGDRVAGGHHEGRGEGLDDLHIAERLYRYIVGGTDAEEGHRTREANDRQNIPSASSSGENEKCSCVFEGDSINIDVTAAGATLALGLIFLRSGNLNMASAIDLPSTHFLLEYVRPDFLALRVVSKALIMWDTVEPSSEWIRKQLPLVVRDAYEQMKMKMKSATDLCDMLESEEGSEPILEGDDAPTNGRGVQFTEEETKALDHTPHLQDYDCQAVRQIYTFVVAGACFALGLRYAGTDDKRAAAAIFERVVELQTLRDSSDSVSVAMRPEPQILETCLGCCAISLALVQAGSGNLETLKLFKVLRWRCDEQVKYGAHMSYGMAIGLLFLGGGTCTLERTPEAVAALVAAFFPISYPISTSDNQYHLQALRHLYALAVKRTDIRFVDVDTGEVVPISIEIKYRDQTLEPSRLTTPCLLPNADGDALEARIVSDKFYPLTLELHKGAYGRAFYVKRKAESLFSRGGLRMQQSLLVQAGHFQGGDFADLVSSLSRNAYMQAFAKYMCVDGSSPSTKSQKGESVEDFCKSSLIECLSGRADLPLPLYLRLRTAVASIEAKSSSSALLAWDFRLIRSFYETSTRNISAASQPLLNIEKVAYLLESVERIPG